MTNEEAPSNEPVVYQVTSIPKKRPYLVNFMIRLVKEKPLGTVGLIIVLALLFCGIFCDLSWLGMPDVRISPYPMGEIHLEDRLQPPSTDYLLGTDQMGRDILSRIIYGARVSMIIGLSATAIAVTSSTILGALSGLVGGKFDLIFQRFVDAWICLPDLLVLLTVMAIVGRGVLQLVLVMGFMGALGGSRMIRSAVIGLRGQMYVEAGRAIGCTTWRLLWRHILPNVLYLVIVSFSIRVGGIIMQEASLSFLGFGVPPGTPSWGAMLSQEGRKYMELVPQLSLWPGLVLSVVVFGCNMFGDAARDLVDPRLRGGVGRGRYEGGKASEAAEKIKQLKKEHKRFG
jgi:peptide/nickel transport system permease protein